MELRTKINLAFMSILTLVAALLVAAGLMAINYTTYDLNKKLLNEAVSDLISDVRAAHKVLQDNALDGVDVYVRKTQADLLENLAHHKARSFGRIIVIDTPARKILLEALTSDSVRAAGPKGSIEELACLDRMIEDKHGSLEDEYKGIQRFFCFDTFSQWNWLIVLSVPTQQMFHERALFLQYAGISLLISLFLGGALLIWLSGHYVQPIHQMAEFTRRVAQGQLGVRLRVARQDELGYLAGALDEMAQTLYEREEERNQTEENLKLMQFSIENSSDSAFWVGLDARFLYVNHRACQMLGYTRDEMLQMKVHDIDPDFSKERWPGHWQELKERGTLTFETCQLAKNGQAIPVEMTTNYLQYGGKEYNFAFARDISERKRAEVERRMIERKIQATAKLESLGVLAGGIAHDFNNLLTGIMGNASLARMDLPASSPLHIYIDQIEKASARAADLCSQMLAYSGKGQFLIRRLDISAVVEETVQLLQVSISKKSSLKFSLGRGIPAVLADPTQLRQVIMNLVINASEAIGDRNGVILVSTGVMHADRAYLAETYLSPDLPEGEYAYLEVSDDGCGMSAEVKAKIFEPFYTTKFTGRGLGLAAVLGIVRGHKGALKVYSEEGRGTTFKFLMPAQTGPADEHQPESPAAVGWRCQGKALVIDDEETVRVTAQQMLASFGMEIVLANDGQEGLELFEKEGGQFTIVLLDLTMPRLDGEETFRELRRLAPDVCVLLMSGFSQQEAVARFAGKGLTGFVQKPFRVETLRDKVQAALLKKKEQDLSGK
ncbi:MAG: response regulator [Candidatus Sumerlaeota bacterium]|nr:response regulator [Candidatus Sumerlaeota bacterium]